MRARSDCSASGKRLTRCSRSGAHAPGGRRLLPALTRRLVPGRGYNVGDEDIDMTFDQFKARVRGRVAEGRCRGTEAPRSWPCFAPVRRDPGR